MVDDGRAEDLDQPGDTGSNRRPTLIDHAEIDADRLPHGSRAPGGGLERVGTDLAGCLGHAVGLENSDTAALLEPAQRRGRQGGRGGAGKTDPRCDGGGRRLVGEDGEDGRDRIEHGHAAAVDHIPEPSAVEAVIDGQRRSGHERGEHADDLGVDVEERQRAVDGVGGREPVVAGHEAGRVQEA